MLDDLPVGGIVIHNQDGKAAQEIGSFLGMGELLLLLKAGREPEGGSFARHAVGANFAVHPVHQLLGDCEPESGAAVFARSGTIGLREGREQFAQRVWLNSDSFVPNLKSKPHMRPILAFQGSADHNIAFVGKLDGVPHQIYQNLAQAPRVAAQALGNIFIDPRNQL